MKHTRTRACARSALDLAVRKERRAPGRIRRRSRLVLARMHDGTDCLGPAYGRTLRCASCPLLVPWETGRGVGRPGLAPVTVTLRACHEFE